MQTLETFEQTLERVADADITAAIERFFLTQKGVAAHLISRPAHRPGYQTAARPRPNPDFVLAERIRHRYFWSASLHNQNIVVLVEKGRATLTGTVATWLDRDTAGYDAYDAGARFVDNDLLIDFDRE